MKPRVPGLALLAALVAAPLFAASPSLAQAHADQSEPAAGRYQFQPVEGGLARLDTATGEIAICRVDPVRMACDMASRAPAADASSAPARPSAEAADEAEFDRALGRMKRVFRAFGDMARDFEAETPPAGPVPNRT